MRITATREELIPLTDYPTISEISIMCADDESADNLMEVFICLMLALGFANKSIVNALEVKAEEYGMHNE